MEIRLQGEDGEVTVELLHENGAIRRCRIDGREHTVEIVHTANQTVVALIDGHPVRAAVAHDGGRDGAIAVGLGGVVHHFTTGDEGQARGARRRAGTGRATAPMPGKVLNVLVGPGDATEIGQALVLLEAMKMELTVTADVDGTVTAVHVGPGDMVEGAQLLLEITPSTAS